MRRNSAHQHEEEARPSGRPRVNSVLRYTQHIPAPRIVSDFPRYAKIIGKSGGSDCSIYPTSNSSHNEKNAHKPRKRWHPAVEKHISALSFASSSASSSSSAAPASPSRASASFSGLKAVIIGDASSGKTALSIRACHEQFPEAYKATIGVDFFNKTFLLGTSTQPFQLSFWDTAGQDAYKSLARSYYRGASAALLCFDVSREETFLNLKGWHDELMANCDSKDVLLFVVGLKSDLRHDVSFEDGHEYASSIHAEYFEVSSKENVHVDALFDRVAALLFERVSIRFVEDMESDNNGSLVVKKPNVRRGSVKEGESSGSVDLSNSGRKGTRGPCCNG